MGRGTGGDGESTSRLEIYRRGSSGLWGERRAGLGWLRQEGGNKQGLEGGGVANAMCGSCGGGEGMVG